MANFSAFFEIPDPSDGHKNPLKQTNPLWTHSGTTLFSSAVPSFFSQTHSVDKNVPTDRFDFAPL